MKTHYTLLSLLAFSASTVASAQISIYAEEFFDYGEAQIGLIESDGGSGWASAWAGGQIAYEPTSGPITYTASGYNNNLNPLGSGGVQRGGGDAGSNRSDRSFSEALSGSIWISILSSRTASNGDSILWLNPTVSTTNFIAIRNNNTPTLRYGGSNSTAAGVGTGTFLLLANVEIDADGANDAVKFWINPDLSSGEAGLGSATLSSSGSDVLGGGLSSLGISFGTNTNASFDALRVGNSLDAVTAVPEPATYAAFLGFLTLAVVVIRRRRCQAR